MAKQVGPLFVTGTIDGIIFYKLGDQYYMRSKGDYKSGKQMRKDPRLKRTMQNADRFGRGSKLVKYIYYRHLPKEVRKPGVYGKLTGMVNKWLYQEKSEEEVRELLIAYCKGLAPKAKTPPPTPAAVRPLTAATGEKTSIKSKEPQLLTVPYKRRAKKARYLSNWKVKRSGQLQVPAGDTAGLPPFQKKKTRYIHEKSRLTIPPFG